jgi:hypothetical protein
MSGVSSNPATAAAPRSASIGRARSSERRSLASRWHLLLPPALVAVLMAPMVFTGSTFGGDWPTHLWLIQMQADNISHLGHPSLFLQSGLGAFEPWYAFYGGTLYSITAAAAVLSGGHTLATYIASFAAAIAMAFGGFAWLARQVGLRGWTAYLAGFVFVTSAYYVADVYSRGAWAEFVATSAIPLLVAAAIALLRAERWRAGPVLAFVVAVVIFSGSHNITLLYGTMFLALLALSVAVAVGWGRLPSWRRWLAVGGLGLLAAGINFWFLLPDVAYEGRLTIAHSFTRTPSVAGGMPLSLLLDPFRHSLVGVMPTLDLQLPVLVIVWSAAVLALCWRGLAPLWRRLAVAVAVPALPFLAVIVVPELWHAVPKIFWSVQFPYRLLSYIDYCAAGLVMIAVLALVKRHRSAARTALVVVGVLFAAFEMGQAMKEAWSGPSTLPSRSESFPGGNKVPSFWIRFVTYHQYQDESLPVGAATIPEIPGVTGADGAGENVISVPVTESWKDGYSVEFTPPRSGTLNTNLLAAPYLVEVRGAKVVARTANQNMLIQVSKSPDGRPTRVTFGPAHTWPIVVGKWTTIICSLVVLGLLAVLAIRRGLWRPRHPGAEPPARGDSWRASPRPPLSS